MFFINKYYITITYVILLYKSRTIVKIHKNWIWNVSVVFIHKKIPLNEVYNIYAYFCLVVLSFGFFIICNISNLKCQLIL